MIAVIDYGAGNLRSVTNALVRLGYRPEVTSDPELVLGATAVFFPGVGAAADAMRSLRESGMDRAIKERIRRNRPLFAICVGMQVLLTATEEGGRNECLGVIPGTVKRLPSGLKVPHIGWNQLKPVFDGIPDEADFYFVHSYYAEPEDKAVVAGTTEYGINMCSILIKGNLIATQFHPEKSGELGLWICANFLKMAGVLRGTCCVRK